MKKLLGLLFIFIFVISACAGNQTTEISDTAETIEVNAGEEFNIVLEANPTTGYHWEIVGELTNIEFVSRDYKASEPITTGSGGVEEWVFKAVSAGETQITLGYYPPSNDAEPAQQTITFIVTVK